MRFCGTDPFPFWGRPERKPRNRPTTREEGWDSARYAMQLLDLHHAIWHMNRTWIGAPQFLGESAWPVFGSADYVCFPSAPGRTCGARPTTRDGCRAPYPPPTLISWLSLIHISEPTRLGM